MCELGELVQACEVAPGDIQMDIVASSGGDMEWGGLWAATESDRPSQWFEAHASWNLCVAEYIPAFEANLRGFPFPVTGLHSDNGPEFLNAGIYAHETGHWPHAWLSRSWPGRKTTTPISSRRTVPC